jgi:GNAT superfamily N-acetyltransferase
MVKFHETLSDRTVYLRYFSSLSLASRTAHERLVRICFSDYEREMVLVPECRDSQTGEPHILGVGRLNKLQTDKAAELAVLVADQFQHRGLGTELVRRLIQIARDEKLSRLARKKLVSSSRRTDFVTVINPAVIRVSNPPGTSAPGTRLSSSFLISSHRSLFLRIGNTPLSIDRIRHDC